jgi:hypothetical protein
VLVRVKISGPACLSTESAVTEPNGDLPSIGSPLDTDACHVQVVAYTSSDFLGRSQRRMVILADRTKKRKAARAQLNLTGKTLTAVHCALLDGSQR